MHGTVLGLQTWKELVCVSFRFVCFVFKVKCVVLASSDFHVPMLSN